MGQVYIKENYEPLTLEVVYIKWNCEPSNFEVV
jgi:hypothetical protein